MARVPAFGVVPIGRQRVGSGVVKKLRVAERLDTRLRAAEDEGVEAFAMFALSEKCVLCVKKFDSPFKLSAAH